MVHLAFLMLLARRERGRLRIRRRELRDASNPLEIPEGRFRYLFRISREICFALCLALGEHLQRRRSNGLPVPVQVLAAVRFYATGSYQAAVGQDICLCQSSVSKCVRSVSMANCRAVLPLWVRFPCTEPERRAIIQRFFDKSNFPCVLGCIDCTQIAIFKPTQEEESFLNHRGFHSLNVQMVCDQDLRILACSAKFPGSVHDQFVFTNSRVKDEMLRLHTSGNRVWLLGDSGYALEPFLLTPIRGAAENSPEERYTNAHCRTRNCIERAFGVLKARWRCLLSDRVLHLKPSVAISVIYSCVVLHNMIVHHRLPLPEFVLEDPQPELPLLHLDQQATAQRLGTQVRQRLIRENFSE